VLSVEVEGWDASAIDNSVIISPIVPVEELKCLSRKILEDIRVIVTVRSTKGKRRMCDGT